MDSQPRAGGAGQPNVNDVDPRLIEVIREAVRLSSPGYWAGVADNQLSVVARNVGKAVWGWFAEGDEI